MSSRVPLIRANEFGRQWKQMRSGLLAAFEDVGASGQYILGDEVRRFEAALAVSWEKRHAVGVASGLDAIEISLRVLGCGPGDKVLTTPLSAFATTLAILKLGAIPVFVDCDDQGLISFDECEHLLALRGDIRYFVPVHLYGNSLNLDRLDALRDRFGLRVVEDCAQSIGTRWKGRPTGSSGQIAATSFYPTKNLGALGDGGALLTSDPDLARQAGELRDYGQSRKYRHEQTGYNSRLDELQAALLRRVLLPALADWIGRRREIAARYLGGLTNPLVRPIRPETGSESNWHLFPVFVPPDSKEDFLEHLNRNGIAGSEHYPVAIVDQPAMAQAAHEIASDCRVARQLCASEVSLPVHPFLTNAEVEHVIAACNTWKG